MSAILALAALLLDQLLGEPRRWHPLVGFGAIAQYLEPRLNRPGAGYRRGRGSAAVLMLTIPPAVMAFYLSSTLGMVFDVLLLYLTIGGKSLVEHGRRVAEALSASDLVAARHRVGMMVSRNTGALEKPALIRATIESLLENGADAVFAPLFWFLLAGAPGALVYRLVNTLDAMWGYRSERFVEFGWCAARLDDLMNWQPARLTAIGYACAGSWRSGLAAWRHQSHLLESPNGGVVMTAGAGALDLELGGPATYQGSIVHKPLFGGQHSVALGDIQRTIELLYRSQIYWVGVLLLGGWLFA